MESERGAGGDGALPLRQTENKCKKFYPEVGSWEPLADGTGQVAWVTLGVPYFCLSKEQSRRASSTPSLHDLNSSSDWNLSV